MKKILLVFMLIPSVMTAQTLDECQQAAERNYPLIRQYDLIKKTTDLTVKNLQKGWLPQLSAQAQATLQSDVTSWPDQMQTMMQQMGIRCHATKSQDWGIKEKILAAKRAGITDIVMCRENKKDIEEIPEKYRQGVTFHYVENVQEVWDFALTDEIVDNPVDLSVKDDEDHPAALSAKGK